MIAGNSIYSLNFKTESVSSLYQVTGLESDTVLKFIVSESSNMIIAVTSSTGGQLSVQTYSVTSFKGFPLSRLLLPDGVDFIYTAQL